MDTNEFPSNSKRPQPASEPKHVERVVVGEATSKKKSLGKRMKEMFIGGDSRSVTHYVLAEVIIPQVKELITEVAQQGLERMIYGDGRSIRRPSSRPGSASHTNYNRYSGRGNNPIGRTAREDRPPAALQIRGMDDIHLQTRIEAETVIERMYDLLAEYDVATVADLFTLVGWTSTHVDQKWGWEALNGANVQKVRDGYILNLPKPQPLD
jgi:hypothetical protein